MGLDIYIHKIVKPRTKNVSSREDWEEIIKQADDDSRKELTKVYDGAVRSLKRTNGEASNASKRPETPSYLCRRLSESRGNISLKR